MKKSRQTKRALIPSVLAVIMCVAMLVGTTFAWFTDTASTSVNKIQAGKLDVALYYADGTEAGSTETKWKSAEGGTLSFLQKNSEGKVDQNANILWEPGCTYDLPELKIVNNENLDLKYKILVTGINSSSTDVEDLNSAIEWTMKLDGVKEELGTEHKLYAAEGETESANIFTISGHMKEEAGNKYQGLSIDGIAITVVATQLNSEFDSLDNTYDEYAKYPVAAAAQVAIDENTGVTTNASTNIKSAQTVSSESTTPLATATIPQGVKTSTTGANSTQLKLTIDEAAVPANFTAVVKDSDVAKTLEVKMDGLDPTNETPITVEMYVGTGMDDFALYHNNVKMTKAGSASAVNADQEYYYDSESGMVTMKTATFSPFTYVYDASIKVASIEDLSVASQTAGARIVKPGCYKLTENITVNTKLYFNAGGVDIDLNGKTLTIAKSGSCYTNASTINVKLHGGYIKVESGTYLWNPSWGTTNLTFDDVDVTAATNSEVFWARGSSTLNVVGSDFNVDGEFLWINPDNGTSDKPSKVNVTVSGANVKKTNYQGQSAIEITAQYNYEQIEATFTNCTFDNTTRSNPVIEIYSYYEKTGNSVSLTMDSCSLTRKGSPATLSDYIKNYRETSNVTISLTNCTGNNGIALPTE